MSRLIELYNGEIVPRLMDRFGISNRLAAPRLSKIVVNMGVGEGAHDPKCLEEAVNALSAVTGQKPVVCQARKSVSGFKVRKGNPVGAKVTLRGRRMYEFMDRLINLAVPRIRDFRGLNPDSFDAAGNYTLGISEQGIFPEIDLDKVEYTLGMDITFVIENSSPEKSLELLRQFGMPFRLAPVAGAQA